MATATVITVPVYQINSNRIIDRTLYPYGMPIGFAGASIVVQPNSSDGTLSSIQAGRQPGAALVYSRITSAATGEAVFFSNLTVAAVIALANA